MTTKKAEPGDLADALARANAIRPMLSAAADALNKAIEEAEQAIAALKLGVRASVNMFSDDEIGWAQDLAFGKEAKTWRLLVETTHQGAETSEVTPLVNASREIRLHAIGLLPDLVT